MTDFELMNELRALQTKTGFKCVQFMRSTAGAAACKFPDSPRDAVLLVADELEAAIIQADFETQGEIDG